MKKLERIILYSIFIIGAIVFSIYDIPITKALYNPSSEYGNVMGLIAELPFLWLVSFAGCVAFRYRDRSTKTRNIVWGIVFLLGSLLASAYSGINLGKDLAAINAIDITDAKKNAMSYAAVLMLISFLSSIVVAYSCKFKDKTKALSWGTTVLGLWVIMIVFVLVFKVLWYRPRYRYIVSEDATLAGVEFLPWWKPNCKWKFTNDFASFPSGHTMLAVGLITLADLPLYPSNKKNRWICISTMLVWFVMTGISRIILGAHFSTDVIFTYGIGLILYDLIFSLYLPGLNKRNQKRLIDSCTQY